jgi:hypothetical protein
MADPNITPDSIVVIHGVGDHKEDETAKAFSRALAQARGDGTHWSPPSLITRTGDVQCEVVVTEAGRPPSEAFTFSAYRIEVPWPGPEWNISLHEFFWSNLSRQGLGLLGELAKIWRFLVGSPRIGYRALTTQAIGRLDGCLLGFARVSYCLSWGVVIVRLPVSLVLILLLGLFRFDFKYLRYYDTMLTIDLFNSFVLILFNISWCLLLLPTLGRRPQDTSGSASDEPGTTLRPSLAFLNLEAFKSATTAAVTLAVTVLFTQAVPFSILEVTKLDEQFKPMVPWRYLGMPYDSFPGFLPAHFYSINTWPGCMVYLIYGLIVLWAVFVMLVQYRLTVLQVNYPAATDVASAKFPNARPDVVVARMNWIVLETKFLWLFVTLLTITLVPLLFWIDYLRIAWYDEGLYIYNPK